MSYRKSACLVALVFVALAPFCHLPVGHGSFTSVYGPHAPLREFRFCSQLMRSVTAIAILSGIYLPLGFDRNGLESGTRFGLSVIAASSPIPTLRC